MSFADRFASRSATGALTRGAVACVLITPMVAAAKLWWSGPAAGVVAVLAVAIYVFAATRYMRHRRPPVA
jgi:integral membrane sensor domain MASE1